VSHQSNGADGFGAVVHGRPRPEMEVRPLLAKKAGTASWVFERGRQNA
jgi:hypothetical protein